MTQQVLGPPDVTFHERPYRHYKVDGLRVPSVTQIIGLLDKPALKHWAQREAVNGVCELAIQYGADDAVLRDPERLEAAIVAMGREVNAATFADLYRAQQCTLPFDRPWDVLNLIKQSEVSINARMKQAAERGTAVHAALEAYSKDGAIPNPANYPEEWRGYIKGLCSFLAEHRPTFHGSEVVVGSREHRYGGRLDEFMTLKDETRRGLVDLKTNVRGRVYAVEHFLQVAAYEHAAVECGHEPTDFQAVLAIGPDGSWNLRESFATAQHFLSLLPAYHSVKELERLDKESQRAAA